MLRAYQGPGEGSTSPEGIRVGPGLKKSHGRRAGGRNDKRYKTLDISEEGRDPHLDNVYIDTNELDQKGEGDYSMNERSRNHDVVRKAQSITANHL